MPEIEGENEGDRDGLSFDPRFTLKYSTDLPKY